MRFLSSAQFIERSQVADEFVAPSAALANRLLGARGLDRLPPCSVSYFVEELHRPGAAIGLHTKGTAEIRLNLAWLADLAQRAADPEWEVAFVVLHEYAHFVLDLLEARETGAGAVRRRIAAEHADFLSRMRRLGWLADPVSRKLLSDHNSVAEEWYCDAFAYWAAGTLPDPHAAFFDELLAGVRGLPAA
ncbi:hypothetical protein IGS68_28205 (plasmid) [Skermanella sp. TT6]|uniref:Metallopeptidase n=1 Tax=Skermanella cutis TaxID=2775420 RepID=A0ABX7BFY5_9PROT|nr:hypothetical protein [Skermanella sp. TT6]QQP93049.1 hypothetical protein IGS68_28205 [Skermanella sp. TT6]